MRHASILVLALAASLALAGGASSQTGSGAGSKDAHGVQQETATLSAACADLATSGGSGGSGTGGGTGTTGGTNGTGGTGTTGGATGGANGTGGAGGADSFPDCMTPSVISVEENVTMVALTLTNDGEEDLCIDVLRGDDVTSSDGGQTGGADAGEGCDALAPGGTNGTTGTGTTGTGTTGTGTTGTTGTGMGDSGCEAGDSGATGGGTTGSTGTNGTGSGATGGTGTTAGNGTTFPVLVAAGASQEICIPIDEGGNVTLVLAESGVAIGRIGTGDATSGGTGGTGNNGTGGTGTTGGNGDGVEEAQDGNNDTPAPGILLVAAAVGLAALAYGHRRRS